MQKIKIIVSGIALLLLIVNSNVFAKEFKLERFFTIPKFLEVFSHNLYCIDAYENIYYIYTGVQNDNENIIRKLIKIKDDDKHYEIFTYCNLNIKDKKNRVIVTKNQKMLELVFEEGRSICGYYGKIFKKIEKVKTGNKTLGMTESIFNIKELMPISNIESFQCTNKGFVLFHSQGSFVFAQLLKKDGQPKENGILFGINNRGKYIPVKVDKNSNFYAAFADYYDEVRNYWSIIKISNDGTPIYRWSLQNLSEKKISQFETVDLDQTKIDLEHALEPYLKALENAQKKGDKKEIEFVKEVIEDKKALFRSHYHAAEVGKQKIEEKLSKERDLFRDRSKEFGIGVREITCFEVSNNTVVMFDKELERLIVLDTEKNEIAQYRSYFNFKEGYHIQDMMIFNDMLYVLLVPIRDSKYGPGDPLIQVYDFQRKKYSIVKYCPEEARELFPREPLHFLKYNEKSNLIAVTPKREGQIKILNIDTKIKEKWETIKEYKEL